MNFFTDLTSRLPFFGKNTAFAQYYFALDIGLSHVTGAVWELGTEHVDIIGQKTLSYQGSDDLLQKANLSLDQALDGLAIEPDKILFGIPDNWLDGDELKQIHLKLLHQMVKEYELEPLAYVAQSNALVHYLQKLDGVPPTAILIGVDDYLSVSLVRVGKVVAAGSAKKSDNLYQDVEALLLSFSEVESLPSKILLYSAVYSPDRLGKIKDELTSHHWMQKLPFLHLPKIDYLKADSLIQAIVFAGAAEVSPDISFKKSFSLKSVSFSSPSPLGKLANLSNSDQSELVKERPALIRSSEQIISSTYAGFVAEEKRDFLKVHQLLKDLVKQAHLPALFSLPSLFSLSPKLLNRRILIVVLAVLGLFTGYLFLVKATVTIFVEPKILTKEAEIIADPKASVVESDKKIIPATVVATTVSGSAKARASGTKQIGESAKGTVIIYNATSTNLNLAQGTTLIADSGLKFTLDSTATVASKSASAADPPTSSSPVGVTATAIGPESNLSARSDLKVGNYSKADVVAKADSAFSGGTSKDITVVTAEDQGKLKSSLTDDLKKKAQEQLAGKLTEGKKIIPDALTVSGGDFSFSKRVNDQATEFSLNAGVSFKGTAYDDADLKTIVSKLVETNVPEGFELNLSETEVETDIAKVEKDGRIIFKAVFKAKLLPKLDTLTLKTKVRGRSVAKVAEEFKGIDNVLGSEIKLTPPLPQPLAYLPLLSKNIRIIVTPK